MSVLDLFRLEGKRALVTGGGQGIGRAFALAMAEAGANVAIADTNEHTGPLVVEEIQALGRDALFVRTDVTDPAAVEAMVQATVGRFGGLDIAVNNAWTGGRAGAFRGRKPTPADFPLDEWDFIHGLLLRAPFLCCRAESRAMMDEGCGHIVNTSSLSAFVMNANVAYCSAKAGVATLTRRLAVELGPYNINVNCISPSYTLSPARRKDPQANRDLIRSLTPMGWHGRPDDLVGTLIYLVSDASAFMTGQNLLVDGGHALNVWLEPVGRERPPLVSPEEETRSLLHDLDVLGIPHDDDGVTLE